MKLSPAYQQQTFITCYTNYAIKNNYSNITYNN